MTKYKNVDFLKEGINALQYRTPYYTIFSLHTDQLQNIQYSVISLYFSNKIFK